MLTPFAARFPIFPAVPATIPTVLPVALAKWRGIAVTRLPIDLRFRRVTFERTILVYAAKKLQALQNIQDIHKQELRLGGNSHRLGRHVHQLLKGRTVRL